MEEQNDVALWALNVVQLKTGSRYGTLYNKKWIKKEVITAEKKPVTLEKDYCTVTPEASESVLKEKIGRFYPLVSLCLSDKIRPSFQEIYQVLESPRAGQTHSQSLGIGRSHNAVRKVRQRP